MAIAAGCASIPAWGDPAVTVTATAETVPVGTTNEDAADDPAIWRNADDPAASLIVATDKKAGLYVYDLDGKQKSFLAGGQLNNVDLVEMADGQVIVGASDRSDTANAYVLLAALDTESGRLSSIDRISIGAGEGYGFCFRSTFGSERIAMVSPVKDGRIYETTAVLRGSTVSFSETGLLHTLSSQPEGCVVDPRNGTLYVGEENAGIWAFRSTADAPRLVAQTDGKQLVADVEGLALAPEGDDGGYLIASSQGDNAYARYSLPDMTPAGRFRIVRGELGATEETDGIALKLGDFGPQYPGGLFVAQDGINGAEAQNFKLVSWNVIEEAFSTWRPAQAERSGQ